MIAGWSPGIGDPTPVGWLTVVAYLAACAAAWRAARRDAPGNAGLWRGFSMVLALLAINKQLDLQSLLTSLARAEARSDGWYDERGPVQVLAIAALTAAGGAMMLWLSYVTRKRGRSLRLAAVGLCLLLLFVCVRAASFHDMDTLLGVSFLALTMNHVLEIAGIAVAGLAALGVSGRRPGGRPSVRRDAPAAREPTRG